MDKFVIKNGKKLRYGYTTGSCAAAATKAAVSMLCSGKIVKAVSISTPKGWDLDLTVNNAEITDSYTSCSIIKDAGDDPDATDGIKIYAKAVFNDIKDNSVTGGLGVGQVTRKGLPAKMGEPAINPGPMKMIMNEIELSNTSGKGISVEISAPEGVEIAKKTFNPRLGILNGISILGTSGIVEPMSNEAFRESLAVELSVLKERGFTSVIMVPGNYGHDMLEQIYEVKDELMVTTSNFIGYMLDQAKYYGFKRILIAGSIGKLVKVAAGIFDTHSRISDARVEILSANYALLGGSTERVKKIMECATTEEALDYIDIDAVYELLAKKIKRRSEIYLKDNTEVEVMLFSTEKGLLSKTENSEEIIKNMEDQNE